MTEKSQKLQKLKTELLGLLGELESDDEIVQSPPEEIINTNDSITSVKTTTIEKKKRELTEKQKEALKRGQEKRLQDAKERRERVNEIAEQEKKKFEEKLIKKALAVKKKQIKEQSILNSISDDEDLPIEKVKKIIKETKEETKKQKEVITEPVKAIVKPTSQPEQKKIIYKFF